ncbi:hypothetical protein [Streptomyces sp. CoH17]|uniref:hypothetical protein n=1 Tax=Streptomyces sp. CoH17 TaxID=2992806 RepID=UPI00226D8557|nr:hypothetical protein [Streptomyces sp. CoH17]
MRPLLAERGCTITPGQRLRTLAEVVDYLGADGRTGIIDGTEVRVRRPAAGCKERDKFTSGEDKQNAVKAVVVTDAAGGDCVLQHVGASQCADITHARKLGLGKLLADGPAVETISPIPAISG